MADLFQVWDKQVFKTKQDITEVGNHNNRSVPPANADPKRLKLNRFIVGGPTDDVGQIAQDLIDEKVTEKYKSNANLAIGLVFSASRDYFFPDGYESKKLDKVAAKKYEEAIWKFVCKQFGKENIVQCVVHYDETTPHFQVIFCPIINGKLNSGHWFDGPAKMKKIHDELAKVTKPLGLKRGVVGRKPSEVSLEAYYKKVNASAKYEENLEKQLTDFFEKWENPPVKYKFNPWALVNDVMKPMVKKLTTNLSHYRTKAKDQEQKIKESVALEKRLHDLELKMETLGLNPKIPFIEVEKIADTVKTAVAESGLLSKKDLSKKQAKPEPTPEPTPEMEKSTKSKKPKIT